MCDVGGDDVVYMMVLMLELWSLGLVSMGGDRWGGRGISSRRPHFLTWSEVQDHNKAQKKANIVCLEDQNFKNCGAQDRHAGRKLPSTVKNLALHGNHCLGIVMSLRIENNHI
jgi:hypothetical protein